ncbi:MAG TPA: Mur ligase family protein [Bacteroidia bacterium]|nr:Mur ligase family protein [Bacteroidia bacterium]HNS11546.1 Mur ligase family protein [Bacteroidia bacterium]
MSKTSSKRVHFIAIGGAAMHNIALALSQNGDIVTGSDDEIAEPSLSRLRMSGLLPDKVGWYPEKIHEDLDAVVLGMHARKDNPELIRAQELGLNIYSYPEYLYEHSKDKLRVVIGGSHGKTTITSMVLFVLKKFGITFDFMVGAKLDGFDTMVQLSDAPIIVLEGDEYLSSPIDPRPKFHLYKADIGLISGIAWDHVNVFPTYHSYLEQFRIFAEAIPSEGSLVYCSGDNEVNKLIKNSTIKASAIAYSIPKHEIVNGITNLLRDNGTKVPLKVFGDHNLMNIEGARNICQLLGISNEQFFRAIGEFKGAARRLEVLALNDQVAVYKDFAHSPSKLKATTEAVRMQFPDKQLIACMELHTFSSLNEKFLSEYKSSMDKADMAIVYFNPKTIEHKKLEPLSEDRVRKAFGREDLVIFQDSNLLKDHILSMDPRGHVFLMMSSGTFDGLSLEELAQKIALNTLASA